MKKNNEKTKSIGERKHPYVDLGNPASIVDTLRTALGLDLSRARAWIRLGLLFEEDALGEDEPRNIFGPKITKADKDQVLEDIHQREQNSLKRALTCYQIANALDPENPDAWTHIGIAHFRIESDDDDETENERYLLKALELDPHHLHALLTLTDWSFWAGDYERAQQYLNRALEAHMDNPHIDDFYKVELPKTIEERIKEQATNANENCN